MRTEAEATVTFRGSGGRNCRGGGGLGQGGGVRVCVGWGVLRVARVLVATLLALASL